MRYPDGSIASIGAPLLPYEVLTLANERIIEGVASKHGTLRYMRLTASIQAVRRVLNRSVHSVRTVAEDNITVVRERATYSHHLRRCYAYA